MANFKPSKVIGALPSSLTPDTVYYVRTGVGFDTYITDNTGLIAYKQNEGGGGVSGGGAALPQPGPGFFRAIHDAMTMESGPDWFFINSGTGAGMSQLAPPALGIGWIRSSTGTTAAGRQVLYNRSNAGIRLGYGDGRWAHRLQLPTLSDDINTFYIRSGLLNNTTGDGSNSCFFRYSHNNSAGQWEGVLVADGVQTAIPLGVTVAVDTPYNLEMLTNSTATEVVFKIDGVICATATSGIPLPDRNLTYTRVISKSVGTAARFEYWDYVMWEQDMTLRT